MTLCRIAVVAVVASLPVVTDAAPAPSAQRLFPADAARATPATVVPDPSPVNIRITAVVTDRLGRAVTDLKAGDFELDDSGVGQTLQSVVLRTIAMTPAVEVPPVLSAEDEQRAARDPSTRVFALFLDEFDVSPGVNSARVRELASRFLSEHVRPQDLLYVMKPMGPVSGLRFTRDRTSARSAIEAFEGRKGDYAPRTPFETEYFGRTPAAVESARAQIVTTGLRELTMKIGELGPARAAMVLVSEGFVRSAGSERRRLPDWQSLARAASHFSLPIYTLDPRDPAAPEAPANDAPQPQDLRAMTLQSLAAQTGGEASPDARNLLPALARMSRDLDTYYVLTYQPSQPTDGRFHLIDVRTKRKAAEVRVPSGYWSPISSEWRTWLDRASAPAGPATPLRMLKRSPLIDTWLGFERDASGRFAAVFTWEASSVGAALRSRPRVVVVKVSTPDGTALYEREIEAVGAGASVKPSDRALVTLPPGRMQLDLSIRAADGTVLDTGAQDVDVPAVRGRGPVLLQPQIVRARTLRDFRTLSALADAAPSPSRAFSRSERLIIRVPAYNPDGGPVIVSALLTNMLGRSIRELPAIPDTAAGATSQFDLPLASLAPGEYGLDLKVSSATGTARQLIRFRITG